MNRTTLFRLVALGLFALLIVACTGQAQPTATPTPTPAPPTDTPVAAEAKDAWERIQAAGTIVVGTSADYPPFESYDENFQLTGFDIALIQEIGAVLGLDVEIKDLAFDGLADALHLGQIDAAIAAISVTPEREEIIDFGQVYFVSQDAFLAASDATLDPINTVQDLAPYRVGVQRASVFQDWLEDELIRTGLMASTDLFVYGQIEEGFDHLAQGQVDLLVLDFQPAEQAVQSQGFQMAAQGLNRERYAIALPKGENTLRTRLNQALLTLQNDGVVRDLAKQYLDLDPAHILPLPTATPEPPTPTPAPQQPTPTPLPGCRDGMAYVADINFDDNNMKNPPVVPPGQPFQKGWRIRNTGTCTWNSDYSLNFIQGNQPGARMGGQATPIQGTVAPGQTYDVYVDLVSPLRPGTYQGFWQMTNPQGRPFGERVYVGIRVPAGPAPTAVPTATPSPGINFTVDRTTIKQGECVTFSWNVQNVQAVYFYTQGEDWQKNGVAGQASRQECPNQTTTYYLRVVKNDGAVETRQITITVQPGNAPNIARFTVEPSGQIATGQCVTLRWDVQGNVQQVNLKRNNSAIFSGAPYRGSYQDCPPGTGDMTYVLEARGPGGTSQATQHVQVAQGPTPTPAPTSVPQPVIDAFSVDPPQIQVNQCVNIAWSTSGGTESVKLLRNGAEIDSGLGLSGSVQDCLSQPGQVTYTLVAANRQGTSVQQQAATNVVAAPQPTNTPLPPPTNTPLPPPTNTPLPPPTNTPVPQAPVINFFSADPGQINLGECVNLSWSFTGQDLAASTITRDGQPIASDVPFDGSQQDCPPNPGQVTYLLKVDAEFGGSAQQGAQVNVLQPQPQPPTITSFSANPPQIDLNNTCTTLEWSISGEGIVAVFLSRNGQQIAGPDVASGYQDCVDPSLAGQNLIYELRVDSEFAGSTSQQTSVQFIAG